MAREVTAEEEWSGSQLQCCRDVARLLNDLGMLPPSAASAALEFASSGSPKSLGTEGLDAFVQNVASFATGTWPCEYMGARDIDTIRARMEKLAEIAPLLSKRAQTLQAITEEASVNGFALSFLEQQGASSKYRGLLCVARRCEPKSIDDAICAAKVTYIVLANEAAAMPGKLYRWDLNDTNPLIILRDRKGAAATPASTAAAPAAAEERDAMSLDKAQYYAVTHSASTGPLKTMAQLVDDIKECFKQFSCRFVENSCVFNGLCREVQARGVVSEVAQLPPNEQ